MKSIIVSVAVAAGLMVAGSAMAVDMPAVAKTNNCTACHKVDTKLVGPAWADVAKKYTDDAATRATLSAKIKAGGKGVWGSMAMTPNPKVSDADMKALLDFVFSLKK